jgi:SM-20-related protein
MENSFEALITSYIEDKVGISENFLSNDLANSLKHFPLNQKLTNCSRNRQFRVIAYDTAVRVIPFIGWIKA